VRLFPQLVDTGRAAGFFKLQRHPRIGGCGDWEMDGSVGSHSAAFYEPYADTGQTAPCYFEQAEADEIVGRAVALGCQTSAHAIGTAAIDRYLASLCKAIDAQPSAEKDADSRTAARPLHRIDHFEFPSPEAVRTVCERGDIAVTVQPGYPWVDTRYIRCYEQYLPAKLVRLEAPLKTLAEAGVCVCGSSDSPVQDIDPFAQMLGMVEPLFDDQRLTPYEALQTYTINPARMLGEQDRLGTLECGKQASFFLTDRDLLGLDGSALAGVQAQQTWVDGRRLEERSGSLRELLALLLKRPQAL
jgi:predicted amidohydrolase YtcJ